MKRKGISDVVATVLILLITVAAVTVLAGYLIPFVKNNLSKSTECIPYNDYFKFRQNFVNESGTFRLNCYQQGSGNYLIGTLIGVDQNTSGDVVGLEIVYKNDQQVDSRIVNISLGNLRTLGNLYVLDTSGSNVPTSGEDLEYVFNSTMQYNYTEVHPILSSGRLCDASDSIDLEPCQGGVNLGA